LKTKPSIVFVQTAFIGDLFLSLPTLDQLKKKYINHQIILICKNGLSEIFLKEKKVDFAFEVQKGSSASYNQVLNKLLEFQIDIVICPHQSFRSSFLTARIKSKTKIVFGSFWNRFFFKTTVVYQKTWPDVIRQLNILTPLIEDLKNEIQKNDWSYLNFKNTDQKFIKIPDVFSYKNTFNHIVNNTVSHDFGLIQSVAIFPGSVWKTKQWSASGFSEVVSYLLKKNKTVFLMGGPAEKNICDEIQSQNPKAINFAGKLSLYESFLKLKDCDLVISNDSAPAHMATSLGISVISIFGPTTVALGFRPWADNAVVIENLNIDCRPCGAHGHHQCPKGHHRCMVDLKPEMVTPFIVDDYK